MIGKFTGHCKAPAFSNSLTMVSLRFCLVAACLSAGCATQHNGVGSEEHRGLPTTLNAQSPDSPIPGYEAPKSLDEAVRRGDAARQAGDGQRAIFEYTQGLELGGDTSTLYARLTAVNYELGHSVPASYAAQKTLTLKPDDPTAHEILGQLFLQKKNYEQSAAHFNATLEATKNLIIDGIPVLDAKPPERVRAGLAARFKAHLGLALIYDLQLKFAEAKSQYAAALALNPRSVQAINNYGYSLYLQEEYTGAMQQYQRALKIEASSEAVWRNIGLLMFRQNKIHEAEDALLRVLEPYEAYNDLGYLLMLSNRFSEARTYFEKAINSVNYYYEPAYKNLDLLERKAGSR
jgi:Tfp pilus assembly protein PilF